MAALGTLRDRQTATLRHLMDGFHQAVDDARRELIRQEGRNVSNEELIRRAGLQSRRSTVARHLNPNQDWGPKGHRVPPSIVQALAAVLPISEADLMKAAQTAAGYATPTEEPVDLSYEVARYLGSDAVSDEEKRALRIRLLEIVTEDLQRTTNGE